MELGAILLILAVGVTIAVAIPRRPIHPGEVAFETHAAELDSGPGWFPPPGWEAEQERINSEAAGGPH